MEGQGSLQEETLWLFIRERSQLASLNPHSCYIKMLVELCIAKKIQIMQQPFNRWKIYNKRSCSNMTAMPTTSNHNTFFNAHTFTLVLSRMFSSIISWCRASLIDGLFLTLRSASNKLLTPIISRQTLLWYLLQVGPPEEHLVAAEIQVVQLGKALLIHICLCIIHTVEVRLASQSHSLILQG